MADNNLWVNNNYDKEVHHEKILTFAILLHTPFASAAYQGEDVSGLFVGSNDSSAQFKSTGNADSVSAGNRTDKAEILSSEAKRSKLNAAVVDGIAAAGGACNATNVKSTRYSGGKLEFCNGSSWVVTNITTSTGTGSGSGSGASSVACQSAYITDYKVQKYSAFYKTWPTLNSRSYSILTAVGRFYLSELSMNDYNLGRTSRTLGAGSYYNLNQMYKTTFSGNVVFSCNKTTGKWYVTSRYISFTQTAGSGGR